MRRVCACEHTLHTLTDGFEHYLQPFVHVLFYFVRLLVNLKVGPGIRQLITERSVSLFTNEKEKEDMVVSATTYPQLKTGELQISSSLVRQIKFYALFFTDNSDFINMLLAVITLTNFLKLMHIFHGGRYQGLPARSTSDVVYS